MCCESLTDVYNFVDFPIYMGTSTSSASKDMFCDMVFAECTQCGTVQLKNLIPLEILYKDSHSNVVGKTWSEHHESFCQFVSKYIHGNIVEIGGSNLMVANILADQENVDEIVVFDNQIHLQNLKSNKITPRQEFFHASKIAPNVDCVVHTHLIEHLYDPIEQLCEINTSLDSGAYMMFAAPILDNMLKDNFTNAMNFEHTYMLTKEKIEYVMKKSGFTIVDVFDFSKYSSFYVCKKTGPPQKDLLPIENRSDVQIFNNFVNYHLKEVQKIKEQIDTRREDTFIFGAHIFTQYLISFGLNEELFANILDNDKNKIGNRLYGTSLSVETPKILKDFDSPLVVLKAAQYTDEIKEDILKNINPNTRFIL